MKTFTNDELLKMACEFDLGPQPIINGRFEWWLKFPQESRRYHVYVKNMGNPNNGADKWAILDDGNFCLNKNGEWQYQSLPSNRDDDFYALCRYDSVYDAISYYLRWKSIIGDWAREMLAQGKTVLEYTQCTRDLKYAQKTENSSSTQSN